MESVEQKKPHAVCIPFPLQGHINAMLNLAKVLHCRGFHITFVNTEFNHRRILRSRGPASLQGLADFRFEAIPDGLPPTEDDASQDIPALCTSTQNYFSTPFRQLINKLNDSSSSLPPVTCIVSDGVMSFTLQIASELEIPHVFFWTVSSCGFLGFLHYKQLIERGMVPLKSESDLTNGYLDTPIDWIPGMKNLRLRDLPSLIRTTDPNEVMLHFVKDEAQISLRATAIVLNTFHDLEGPVLDAMETMLPPMYPIGPLCLLSRQMPVSPLASIGANLWKEDPGCLEWLDRREAGSVLYVNFGSLAVMTNEQLIEFAWGLANCGHDFLWVIRDDLVMGDSAVLPEAFLMETKGRSLLVSWCPQEEVLLHPGIGGFLTHSGWNSTMESMCAGVPMICWALFAEQPTNCWFVCNEWGIGMEISVDARREEVEKLIRELMMGEKGKDMKRKALEWKERAIRATQQGGPSLMNLERVINEVLRSTTA